MTRVLQEATLRLAPEPVSARAARGLVRALLTATSRQQWSESAELAVSEVVSNAVLHAHSWLAVTVRVLPEELQVEVADGSAQLPVQRDGGAQATTGRGLDLVAAVTSECGVRTAGTGKVVWFVVRGDGTAEGVAGTDPTGDWVAGVDLQGLDADGPQPARPDAAPELGAAGPRVAVVLLALPPQLWLAAEAHHDALLREYALSRAGSPGAAGAAADADAGRRALAGGVRAAITAAGAGQAPQPVDVTVHVPPGARQDLLALRDVLDEAEGLALAGRLLISPALPEIVAVRDWAVQQGVAQLGGSPPTPWEGVSQDRFLDRVEVAVDVQATGGVAGSQRGLVAADEANRILAVSPPLAAALGWQPADLVGRRIVALVPPALREAHVTGFSRHVTTGEQRILGVPLRLPVLCRDGREVLCEVRITLSHTHTGRTMYVAEMTPLEG